MNPYYAIVHFAVQFLLAMLAAIVSAIVAYGAIAATIIGVLGPIFIPFLVIMRKVIPVRRSHRLVKAVR